jgi:hypothetical protein
MCNTQISVLLKHFLTLHKTMTVFWAAAPSSLVDIDRLCSNCSETSINILLGLFVFGILTSKQIYSNNTVPYLLNS